MSAAVVLDAAGAFDVIDDSRASGVRALLRRTIDNGGEVRCVAVTLEEVCRGSARTRRVEAALRRSRRASPKLVVRQVQRWEGGSLLHTDGAFVWGRAGGRARAGPAVFAC